MNEGSSRLSIPRKIVDRAISPDLIAIQDEIRTDFGWSLGADLNSANNLLQECELRTVAGETWSETGRYRTMLELQEKLISTPITILGAAAIVDDVSAAIEDGHGIIAADGAVGVLAETGFTDAWDALLCVVSDADGDGAHLAFAAELGVPFVLHAHGDNSQEWQVLLDVLHEFNTPLILTHQTPDEIIGMENPGGFTDGDRAVCFALAMKVKPELLTLRGFATDHIGQWTGSTNPKQKMRKLEWMACILELAGVKW